MFTGIIQNTGTLRAISKDADWRLEIETDMDLSTLEPGASVACAGCCLTVTDKGESWFAADVSAETLSKTTIGNWQPGTVINLEPSLRLGDELGGHFVFGHVDGLAELLDIQPVDGSRRLLIRAPGELMPFIAPKGSVSLDGVSLTVNTVEKDVFSVNIIPHSWARTTLRLKQPGDTLNLEIDMLARYVARMLGGQDTQRNAA